MLPDRDCVKLVSSGMLLLRPDRGSERKTDGGAVEGAVGRGAARGGRPTLPSGSGCRDAHALPDGPAGGRWQAGPADRLDDPPQRGHGTPRPWPVLTAGSGCGATSVTTRSG